MIELPPLEHPESDDLSLGWHALNYRTANTLHAEAMYQELCAFVRAYAEQAVRDALSTVDNRMAACGISTGDREYILASAIRNP